MFHSFKEDITGIPVPEKFTFPFHYSPHKLTEMAADEVMAYLATRDTWQEELHEGKMFGTLVVRSESGEIGYLAAFSGNLAGSNFHSFFVPPVFDFLKEDGYFKQEERAISEINRQIESAEYDADYIKAKEEYISVKQYADEEITKAKCMFKEAKAQRERRRKEILGSGGVISVEESQAMIRESQFQKAELKRLEKKLEEKISSCLSAVSSFEEYVSSLKLERKKRSAALQLWLFRQFDMLNANGESKNLCDIFRDTPQGFPPAGAGECALPKLLQYAYLNNLVPLAMGEFWYGMSPKDEIRHHGHFYPSCKGKCEPILKHMLLGLDVEPNPLADDKFRDVALRILYEDEWMVAVDKPSGMLSVPGKNDLDSVQQRLMKMYPHATGPMVVHRLDMSTSGILLAAKTKEVHALLQSLFENRLIEKQYIAVLDGVPDKSQGEINLPICLNPLDRPRQIVDFDNGKPATTSYKLVSVGNDGRACVVFSPHTGRTHQLRVHSAHPLGLNCPISGDELYGNPKSAGRLCLHASKLSFRHPVTGFMVNIESLPDFI